MKQPLLGQKIQEWRKAKGMTQEELVERCNINVRTIQRIEAGEVTPRNYTIKSILDALGVQEDLEFSQSSPDGGLLSDSKKVFGWAALAGLLYFIASIFEIYWDGQLVGEFLGEWEMPSSIEPLPWYYALLKITVGVTYTGFMYGFYRLAVDRRAALLKMSVVGLLILNVLIITWDIMIGMAWVGVYEVYGIAKVSTFGLMLLPFSAGLILLHKRLGNRYLVTGAIGVVTGFLFLTFVLVLPGLIVWTVFDLLLIFLLFSLSQQGQTSTDGHVLGKENNMLIV